MPQVAILKAKKGELTALENTTENVAKRILPLFDVGKIIQDIAKRPKWLAASKTPIATYLDATADGIATAWRNRPAMIDAYQWDAHAQTEFGSHILGHLISRLGALGMPITPVIGYDRWESDIYRLALQSLQPTANGRYCLRLDSHAIQDISEPDFFRENITAIIEDLDLNPSACSVLIDFGDVSSSAIADLLSKATELVSELRSMGFKLFITAGCSIPKTIDLAVKKRDSSELILRREMLLWKALRQNQGDSQFLYGDYGVRGPNTNEGVPSPHTNGKIRYTTSQGRTFIVRGHAISEDGSGVQMYGLAEKIAASEHYLGESFSWGDWRISLCRHREFMGNPGQWIAIDTNHHLAQTVHEVAEFERSTVVAKV